MAPTRVATRGSGVIGALAALAVLHAGPARAETRALLIGVGAYSQLPADYRLSAPARDLGRLTSSLLAAGVPAGAIRLVSDARDGEGDRLAILAALHDLVDRTRAGDRVMVYFTGHGGQRPASHPEREPDGLEEVWLAGDARIGADGAPQGGVIADHEITDVLAGLMGRGADVWLVVDACYAGGVTRGAGSRDAAVKSVGGRGRARAGGDAPSRPSPGGEDGGLLGTDLEADSGGPGGGRFAAFYAAGAGDLAQATASGSVFTTALARALDSGRVASLRDLTAALLSVDARLGVDAPRPVFEGELDRPVLDLSPGPSRRFALRRSAGSVAMAAGAEEGIEPGSTVALEAADGARLGTAVVERVSVGSSRLAGAVAQGAVAARPVARVGATRAPAERILSAIEALGGGWANDTLEISARLERPSTGDCAEPVDPQRPGPQASAISLVNPPPLQDCDRLFVTLINRGPIALDVNLLFLAADGGVVGPSLHPLDEVRLKPGERRNAALRIVAEPEPVIERLAVIALPATSRFPLDLRYLATPLRGGPDAEAGDAEVRWWRAVLDGGVTRGEAAEPGERAGATPVAVAFPFRIVP